MFIGYNDFHSVVVFVSYHPDFPAQTLIEFSAFLYDEEEYKELHIILRHLKSLTEA